MFKHYRLIHEKFPLPKNTVLIKNPQCYSDLAEILVILPTHRLIILTKLDENMTKIVNYSLIVYFWDTVIFFNQSLVR